MTDEIVNDETVAGDGGGDGTECPPEPIEGQEELEMGGDAGDTTECETSAETGDGHETSEEGAELGDTAGETGETGDGSAEDAASDGETEDDGDGDEEQDDDEKPQTLSAARRTLQELHDDIEAALFAAQDLGDAPDREKAVIVQKLEAALTWTKKALEKS